MKNNWFPSSWARLPRGEVAIAFFIAISSFVEIAFMTTVEPSEMARTKILRSKT